MPPPPLDPGLLSLFLHSDSNGIGLANDERTEMRARRRTVKQCHVNTSETDILTVIR